MNAVELALEKQRLQLAAAAQRQTLAQHAAGLQPLFHAADQMRDGARWIRRHPEIVAGGVAVLVAARPKARQRLWRWGKRAFIAWRVWRDVWLESERWQGISVNHGR